jgi:hypothetical protein
MTMSNPARNRIAGSTLGFDLGFGAADPTDGVRAEL